MSLEVERNTESEPVQQQQTLERTAERTGRTCTDLVSPPLVVLPVA